MDAPKEKTKDKNDEEDSPLTKEKDDAVAAVGAAADDDNKPKPPMDDLFGADDEDELFGSPLTKTASKVEISDKPTADKSHSRPKKLPGAVSMFGGIDPFAAIKKKNTSEDKEESDTDIKASTVASPKQDKTFAFNPAAMMPGAVHPSLKKLEKSESVDFDQPVESETLQTATKDRAKGISRRRPQSRKARRSAVGQSGDDIDKILSATSPTIPEIPNLPDILTTSAPPTPASPTTTTGKQETEPSPTADTDHAKNVLSSQDKKTFDLFGNDDFLDGPSLPRGKNEKPDSGQVDDVDSLFKKELFAGQLSATSSPKPGADDSVEDLFSAPLAKSGKWKSPAPKSTPAGDNEDVNDLFSKPSAKSKNDISSILDKNDTNSESNVKKDRGSKAAQQVNAGKDNDDLFASVGSSGSSSSMDKKKKKIKDSEEDDLFSTSPQKSATAAPKNGVEKKQEEEDDIFADSSLNKKTDSKSKASEDGKTGEKRQRPKKAMTKESTLLADSTDIFSDIPDTKPKVKETTKKPRKVAEKKSVFKDDVDDIFSDASAATVKTKKDSTKKKLAGTAGTKSATAGSLDNIFDDPLS